MQISSMLTAEEIKSFQQDLYSYFETGYAFEEFLKEYLSKMGLDEVEVTQRSRDGGIDLTAIRKGVGDFSEIDITHYYIQAKRNALKSKVSVQKVRELKGTIPFGYKGMFITTSDFTADAITEATNDPSKPVVAISGKALVMSCIDNEIGFLFKPMFSKTQMDLFLHKAPVVAPTLQNTNNDNVVEIEKIITTNDVRARIVSIPKTIMNAFSDDMTSVKVQVNDTKEYTFNIIRGRNYFGGVTAFLKEFNMLSDDGVITPKKCKWQYDATNKVVKLYLE